MRSSSSNRRVRYLGWGLLVLPVFFATLPHVPRSGRRLDSKPSAAVASPPGSEIASWIRPSPGAVPSTPEESTLVSGPATATATATATVGLHGLRRRSTDVIRYAGRVLASDPAAADALAGFQRRLGEGRDAVALVGLSSMPVRGAEAELGAGGIELLDFVPDNGWIARVQGRERPSIFGEVVCFQPLDASWRVAPGLRERVGVEADVPLYVHLVRDRSAAKLIEVLRAAGFDACHPTASGDRVHLSGRIPGRRLEEFLGIAGSNADVQWIEAGGRARLLNDRARRVTQGGSHLGAAPFHARGIHGTDQVIAICDTGLDVDQCHFRDPEGRLPPFNRRHGFLTDFGPRKVVAVDFLDPGDGPEDPGAWDDQGHGTAVAGCAAGSNLDDPWGDEVDNGMAPGARLIVQDAGYRSADGCAELPGLGCPVTNFLVALDQAAAQGATIHNNSWGDREGGPDWNQYTQTCRELDWMTWSNRRFLVVCAAGNDGIDDSVGSPSTAKNGLSVGATRLGIDGERVAGFSSRGWASDGRYKPDLCAPGQDLRTAASDGEIGTDNCYRTFRSGTSFASPVVAGLAALVRDYFARGDRPSGEPVGSNRRPDPSAALVKAVLINAAVPVTGAMAPPPARDQGWGRVQLSRTLPLAPGSLALRVVDEEEGREFGEGPAMPYRVRVRMRAADPPLKVTLVWTDPPATPGADRHLVNDLDLRVRTPWATFKGNVLADGRSVAGGEYDRLNNVEQVVWTPDRTGLVEISVWPRRIVVGPQDFALVITGAFEETSPTLDADRDGMADAWEEWHFEDLRASPADDPDGDGLSNAEEFAANTDPTDDESVPRLEVVGFEAGAGRFRMRAAEGRTYTLERATGSLVLPVWRAVSAPVFLGEPDGDGFVRFVGDTSPTEAAGGEPCFYRVRIEAVP